MRSNFPVSVLVLVFLAGFTAGIGTAILFRIEQIKHIEAHYLNYEMETPGALPEK